MHWPGLLVILTVLLSGCAEPKYEVFDGGNDVPANLPPTEFKMESCALRFSLSGYCLFWQWQNQPVGRAPGTLTFKVVRANLLDGSPMPADPLTTPQVVLWMPSMDHGSAKTQVQKVDTGSYLVNRVIFVMEGDWEIRFISTYSGQPDVATVRLFVR